MKKLRGFFILSFIFLKQNNEKILNFKILFNFFYYVEYNYGHCCHNYGDSCLLVFIQF